MPCPVFALWLGWRARDFSAVAVDIVAPARRRAATPILIIFFIGKTYLPVKPLLVERGVERLVPLLISISDKVDTRYRVDCH
jgi:hypothetical protein